MCKRAAGALAMMAGAFAGSDRPRAGDVELQAAASRGHCRQHPGRGGRHLETPPPATGVDVGGLLPGMAVMLVGSVAGCVVDFAAPVDYTVSRAVETAGLPDEVAALEDIPQYHLRAAPVADPPTGLCVGVQTPAGLFWSSVSPAPVPAATAPAAAELCRGR